MLFSDSMNEHFRPASMSEKKESMIFNADNYSGIL